MARRTAVTLMGSKVAFRTRTGSCIQDGRLAGDTEARCADPSAELGGILNRGRGRKPFLSRLSMARSLSFPIWNYALPETSVSRAATITFGRPITALDARGWRLARGWVSSGTTRATVTP